jgi:aldehyde:ferredoxin oxidoreductase
VRISSGYGGCGYSHPEYGRSHGSGYRDILYTPDEILSVGERINNLARAFNVREGFTRADDTFPERLMTEPIPGGVSKGHFISREELKLMLDEYYIARGWDVKTGSPTRTTLKALNLEYAADVLNL